MQTEIEQKHTKAGTFLNITFDTGFGQITVYGCQRRTGTSQNGAYDFISTPARMGKDKEGNDKLWTIVRFSDEVNCAILREIDKVGGNDDNVPF